MLLEQTLFFINIVLVVVIAIATIIYVSVVARVRGWAAAIRAPFKAYAFWPTLLFVLAVSYIRLGINFLYPSEVGVVISVLAPGGYYDRAYRSGLHWTFPFLERMDRYSYSWQIYEMTSNPFDTRSNGGLDMHGTNHVSDVAVKARTADGQEVSVDCSVIYQIEPDQIIRVYIEWQSRYVQDFLRPVSRGMVRNQISQYTAAEVNSSKSLALERDINQQLRLALDDKGFALERFILRSVTFTPEYASSIEQKQIALENALKSEHEANRVRTLAQADADAVTTRAKADAGAVQIRAESEANALAVISNTLQNNRTLLTYRYIDKLSPQLRVMMVPNNTPFFMNLPILDEVNPANMATPIVTNTQVAPTLPVTTPPPTVQPTRVP